MTNWKTAASAVALGLCLAPATAQAQSLEDVLARLERLEQENRQLRQEVDSLKGAAPISAAPAPVAISTAETEPSATPIRNVEAPTPENDRALAAVELNSGLFVSRASR